MSMTEAQLAAVEAEEKFICVDAGAGSGKTSVLIQRIIHLLENANAGLDEIVAITFTEKAAGEMKDRLRRECRAKSVAEDPTTAQFWRDIERRIDAARITTIHAFCMRLLKENALTLGLDPDFTILSEAESYLLRSAAVEETLQALIEESDAEAIELLAEHGIRNLSETLMEMLSKHGAMSWLQEEHPVDSEEKLYNDWLRLLELASAESFERLLCSSEFERIRCELDALETACTQADDLRELLRKNLVHIAHALSARLDLAQAQQQIANLRALKAQGGRKQLWRPETAFDDVKRLFAEFKLLVQEYCLPDADEKIERLAARQTRQLVRIYEATARRLSETKEENAVFDFDDLILCTYRVLKDNAQVRAATAGSIRQLLIDEFQDTDPLQLEIALLLANEPSGPNLFIVGDAKQSIYYFRGADVAVFLDARSSANRLIRLDTNFRTVPDVLHFINDTFSSAAMRLNARLPYAPLVPSRPPEGAARVEFLVPRIGDDTSADACRRREAELLASRIREICDSNPVTLVHDERGKGTRPARFGDVAILFRSYSSVHIVERSLRLAGIPYHVIGGAGFYERQEILDIRNLLTVVLDPWNEMALLAFIRSPIVGMSDNAMAELCLRIEPQNPLVHIFNTNRPIENFSEMERLHWARALLGDLANHVLDPLPEFIRFVLDKTGYEAIALSQFLGVQKASNVRKLIDLADAFGASGRGSLRAFVAYLEEIAAKGVREGDALTETDNSDVVTLCTIHKAKGLEFPIVVLPDTSRSMRGDNESAIALHRDYGIAVRVTDDRGERQTPVIFDLIRKRHKEREQEEHRRILYVGMTRARDWLVLSGSIESKKSGENWFDGFNERLSLESREHNEVITRGEWSLRVLRDVSAPSSIVEPNETFTSPSMKQALRRIAPLSPSLTSNDVFPVSELLDALFPNDEKDDASSERDRRKSHQPEAPDPRMRGALIHRMFELWDFDRATEPPIDSVLLGSWQGIAYGHLLKPDMINVARVFQSTNVGRKLATSGGLMRETPFLLKTANGLIKGVIDVATVEGTIVDFKSGKRAPRSHARYEWQIQLYCAAMRALCDKKPTSAIIYYVDSGEEIDAPADDATLDSVIAEAERMALGLRQSANDSWARMDESHVGGT